MSTSATERPPLVGRALLALRDFALRWRLALLGAWWLSFPLLAWLYLSSSTMPPTALGDWEVALDKWLHAAVHGFMVALPTLLVGGRWRAPAMALGFATAVALEIGQLHTPGRSFEWLDLVANIVGALLGWWAAARLRLM